MREQADYYADLMDIMLEKADLGKVGAVAIDGTSDSNTFNSGTGCQIWDASGNEKPAFYAVIGAPNRHKMGKAIEAGPALSEELKYTPETWAPYAAALQAAEALVDVRIYDADGACRVFIFRNNNGTVEIGTLDEEKIAEGLGVEMYVLAYNVYYYDDKKVIIFDYMADDIQLMLDSDDFIFKPFDPDHSF